MMLGAELERLKVAEKIASRNADREKENYLFLDQENQARLVEEARLKVTEKGFVLERDLLGLRYKADYKKASSEGRGQEYLNNLRKIYDYELSGIDAAGKEAVATEDRVRDEKRLAETIKERAQTEAEAARRAAMVNQAQERAVKTMEDLDIQIGVLRGDLTDLDAETMKAGGFLDDAFLAGLISVERYGDAVAALREKLADLQKAREEAGLKREGESLTEAMRTPEERLQAEADRLKGLLEGGAITGETYNRAVEKALQEAARAVPETMDRVLSRGVFGGANVEQLSYGGPAEAGIAEIAKNTARANILLEKFNIVWTN
jgi:hypothetical protein